MVHTPCPGREGVSVRAQVQRDSWCFCEVGKFAPGCIIFLGRNRKQLCLLKDPGVRVGLIESIQMHTHLGFGNSAFRLN